MKKKTWQLDPTKATTKEVGEAMQFRTKREAMAAAREVPGYGPGDVIRQDIMGFQVWVISDPHMSFLRRDWFCSFKGQEQGIMTTINGRLIHA